MPSLNLDLNYFDHAKTMRIETLLGNGADVLPIRLWTYVGRHSPELGCLAMLEAELERICRWWGEKGAMVSAMIEIGFLERDGELFQVHDWHDHSGHLATFKKRAIKAARKRWGVKRKSSNATSNAKYMSKQCPSSAVHSSALHINRKKSFSKPLPQDVTAYGASIGFKIDGSAFCDFYESKGWKIGNSPMKSWQAAVRTWKHRPKEFSPLRESMPAPALPKYKENRPREEDIFDPSEKDKELERQKEMMS